MSAIMPTYRRYPATMVRGEGLRVFDSEGRAYLDFAAGIAVVPLGHGHPRWRAAVTDQLGRLTHVSNLWSTVPQERLAERLASLADAGSVFFSNSGAEANEAALKLARLHGLANGGRTKVVALAGSFHGRTFATLAATGQAGKHEPFAPLPGPFVHVPPNDEGALAAAVDETTAAVLVEPILGEGGVLPLTDGYLSAARSACDRHGALLAMDEVQTGIGRCGTWFAFQGTPVRPDVFTLAKALANGLPIGATIARPGLAFGPGLHGSTFGGGPVVCAGALAVLDVIEDEGLLANATAMGARLAEGLAEAAAAAGLPGAVRGRGLLLGIPVAPLGARDVVLGLMDRGFLATEAGGEVVRVTPPLTVDAAAVDSFVEAVGATLAALAPAHSEGAAS